MINNKALSLYLSYKHVPTPLSIIEGKGRKMADVRCPDFSQTTTLDEDEIVGKLDRLLGDALIDLGVTGDDCVLLSGGIDSGIVAMAASKLFGKGKRLKTFCITYDHESEGKSVDREYSRQIADLCGSKHTELMIKLSDFPTALVESSHIMGEPFSGYVTPWFAGKMLAEHGIHRVLTGDWGDELFGSYKAHRLAAQMPGTPSWAVRYKTIVFNDIEVRFLLRDYDRDVLALDHLKYEYYHSNLSAHDSVNRMLEAEFRSFYPDHTYLAFSKLTNHFRVNAVSPYSNDQFADFAASIPGHLKVTPGGETKYIEKKLAERYLPKEIVYRHKEGFTTNTLKLCTDLEQWVKSTLRPEHLNRHELFNVEYVESIISRFYNSPNDDDAYKVWNLVCFQVWYDRYFGYV